MNASVAVLLLASVTLAATLGTGPGCRTKPDPAIWQAYQAGQQSILNRQQAASGIVLQGEVRKHMLLWTEGMTLATALVAAEYTGFRDPSAIYIVRGAQRYEVNPKALTKGQEDPILEPGDLIQILP